MANKEWALLYHVMLQATPQHIYLLLDRHVLNLYILVLVKRIWQIDIDTVQDLMLSYTDASGIVRPVMSNVESGNVEPVRSALL